MIVRILGKRWEIIFVPQHELAKDEDGLCDAPDTPAKALRILDALEGEALLETVIHEFTHAADWSKDDAWVHPFGRDLARVLWRLGYRR